MVMGDKEYVTSSNVDYIAYDPEEAVLEVGFLNGGAYQYFDVPEDVYEDFLNSESKGKFLFKHIKNKYSYRRV
jgi:hypothetical protein